METFTVEESQKFKNPEEEIRYLREQIAQKEKEVAGNVEPAPLHVLTKEAVTEYRETPAKKVLAPSYQITKQQAEAIVLDLTPEPHDKTMEELLGILQEKGIHNALSVVAKLNSPHIEDDFHRLLAQYIKGHSVKGVKEKSELFKALHMTLYEVSLPSEEKKNENDKTLPLKELISKMEQFYAGMISVSPHDLSDQNFFTIEVANGEGSEETIFYVSVPDLKKDLFEKQILSVFPNAKIKEQKDDYNIFSEGGYSVGASAHAGGRHIFPLKTYDKFDYDPLNVLLNTFSKIKKEGEGAALQLVFCPVGDTYAKRYKMALDRILQGVSVKRATRLPDSAMGHVWDITRDIFTSEQKIKHDKEKPVDQIAVEDIKEKIQSPTVEANIRVLVSSKSKSDADRILSEIESAFNQFQNPHGNKLEWKNVSGKAATALAEEFSFRFFKHAEKMPLNIKELTSLLHFPQNISASSPSLRQAKAGTAPAPLGLPTAGTVLGVNRNRNQETKIYMTPEDRLRHFYTIGQTGTGKTTLLKNMIAQDILAGNGVCFIDPHGSDIQDILEIIPKERYEDVIYFDPGQVARPMALNMLEYDTNFPEQKTFVVNELFSIFQKLYGKVPESMGPMFEQYFRNATMLVIEDPDSGSTLLEVSRVMANKQFRDLKLSKCKNPVVSQFWREIAEKAGGEGALANIVPYITSKFDVFLANEIMRPIIAQEKSSFNFREIMDNKKILLVNLSKGRLGEINSNLIGLILVGKILMAALSRVDSMKADTPPFYLFIDEFQNITTNSIASILSEARKYKLSLSIAHQFIAQLEDEIKDAVFGNVGSIAAFRVGAEDAEYLEKQFEPVFTRKDLINLDNRNAYLKLLSGGKPLKPFNIETLPPPKGNPDIREKLKELSYLKFGRPREEIEEEVLSKYNTKVPAPLSENSPLV